MSERERERFEAQTRLRSSFAVFSCGVRGVGIGELEVSGANFLVEEDVLEAVGILSQAEKIENRHHEQRRHNFSDLPGSCLPAKVFATLIKKTSESANTTRCASKKPSFLRLDPYSSVNCSA